MSHISRLGDTIRVGSEAEPGTRYNQEFEIEPMEGDFTRSITVIEETPMVRIINGVEKITMLRKMKVVQEKFTKGYMIYFPQAHSVFVAADDIEQLEKIGVPLDAEGSVVLDAPMHQVAGLSAKEAVMKSEGRRRRSTVGGIEEAMKG